jgi:hypothetical protein
LRRALALASFCAALWPAPAGSAEPELSIVLACRRESGPGRVLCEAEIESREGRLTWADVVVLEAPEFAKALRVRIGPLEATAKSERRLRLPLALLAVKNGKGVLVVRARAVVCKVSGSTQSCLPKEGVARTEVEVGPVRSSG